MYTELPKTIDSNAISRIFIRPNNKLLAAKTQPNHHDLMQNIKSNQKPLVVPYYHTQSIADRSALMLRFYLLSQVTKESPREQTDKMLAEKNEHSKNVVIQ